MRKPSLTFLRQLQRDQSGLALIEFAYSLPVLLALTLGGLEVANLAITHMKLSQLAMLVADNASRVRASIDEADINEIFSGAALSANGLNFAANGKIFLSDLESNKLDAPKTGQYIRWQRCYGSGNFTSTYGTTDNGKTDASLQAMGPTGNQIAATNGTAVMFVEVAYKYQPLISNSIFGEKTIRYTSAFNVRERTDQAMKNAGNLSTSQTAACS
ncbi:pilus assembly protein [Sphingobium yanoikuyae]|uniref:Pilus assembly protein n=1 Tax=Sphingobium yanoikuyae TaxID=13690 RepID=A0A6P1GDN6_SPHYA|nr:TadE/TadG family type IV pilus assembly protein [Sphingobium yanoikuyae]QHD66283.1 pilus assembly protein [Sphingobium yanoikuyae]